MQDVLVLIHHRPVRGVVAVVVRAFDYDCVCAHDAHGFSIDFFGKPMPS